jgi:hypothetical protein
MPKRLRIYVVLVFVREKKIVNIFWKCIWTNTCVSENVRMKPRPEVGSLGKPWICEDSPAPYLYKSAGLAKIGNTHIVSAESPKVTSRPYGDKAEKI